MFLFVPRTLLGQVPPKVTKKYKKWCFLACLLYHLREKIAKLISTALIIVLIIFLLFPWSSSILPIPARLDGLFIPPGTRSRHLDTGTMLQPTFYTTENGQMSLQEGPFSRGNESEHIWTNCFSGDMLVFGGVHFRIFNHHFPPKKTTQMPSSSELGVLFVTFEKGVTSDPYFRCLKGHGWKKLAFGHGWRRFSSSSIYFPDN